MEYLFEKNVSDIDIDRDISFFLPLKPKSGIPFPNRRGPLMRWPVRE